MFRFCSLLVLVSLPSATNGQDWSMLYRSSHRNNVSDATNLPVEFDVETGKNIKWVAKLGSQSYGSPVTAHGQIYIGTNNQNGYLKRFPSNIDLGCLLCFRQSDGRFLWQYSATKLPTGRVHDWPLQGICSVPLIEKQKMWFVSNQGKVVCLDTLGHYDGEDQGIPNEKLNPKKNNLLLEADVIWEYDMMAELGISQHNMATCAPAAYGDVLFINTSNGLDSSHIKIPAPDAPTFIALNKNTGELLWADNPAGKNILHGQWSCPAVGVFDGVAQVIFPAGDGWIYSYRADEWQDGKPILLWKFDGNPKTSKWVLGGRGRRNNIIAPPVIHENKVYFVMGQDPEHGEGLGDLWCLDPTRRGDLSAELVVDQDDHPAPHRRIQAVDTTAGEKVVPNPNSGVVWHFDRQDVDGDGLIAFEEEMHRSLSTPVIKDGLLYQADFAGMFYCIDANTGKVQWSYDTFASCWSTPLVADGKVFLGDEDGDVAIFEHGPKKKLLTEIYMENSINSTPIAIGETLYISTRDRLYAIRKDRTPQS
ncbi:MAG: PQQ-binding-like beta-propeller repeat protein [Planctomycetaceae bacterium]|nr:PQQ-binding-like beta-propeller repeat protein [Planctomycetaceae bacterium]